MNAIDRVAAVLKPTALMLAWINQHGVENNDTLSLAEAQMDRTILLLPMFEDEEAAEQHLFAIYHDLFINELMQWNDDESAWPIERDFDTFLAWFDIEFHSSVYDTGTQEEDDEEDEDEDGHGIPSPIILQ